jgi:hypothetical protein
MTFAWPEFNEKQPLGRERSWDARFDSYDQYRELCYYTVRLYEGEVPVADFMVEVGIEFAGDDWSGPSFSNELRSRVAGVAATGKTNTDYAG